MMMLDSRSQELFEQLRKLRSVIAGEENVPPYIIFSDKTLVDMCVTIPLNKEEMLRVKGVGENKFSRFGERFLQIIRNYTGRINENLSSEEEKGCGS